MTKAGNVLVVDDEDIVCRSVRKILTKADFNVDTVLNATDALEKIRMRPYDVVITDLMMPGLSGMQLLEKIMEDNSRISVIMITGYATVRTAVQAIKLGAFDYIPKPFTPEEMTSVAVRAAERTRLAKEQAKPGAPAAAEEAEGEAPEAGELLETEETEEEFARLAKDAKTYTLREHAWARVESDGNVRIGAEEVFQRTAGEIINVDLPFEGDEISQGEVCVRVTASGLHIHKLWAPVSGRVIRVNNALGKNAGLVNRDPYGKGWIVRIEPFKLDEDLRNLQLVKESGGGKA